ncbi:probable peroxidase 26 [Andrographis paniculata]|uniref:probable peroxidase 26 n=1 Tax=Andrographis paniculata TaxID=175694 RepID=UPI0021E87D43|nr:probable peroxidase 26 [Andrographis paniculata]
MKKVGGLEGLKAVMISAVALSLVVGRVQAAVTLPPEDKPLMRHYYKKTNTCANAEAFVRHQVRLWWDRDPNITASLLKILYADCLVNGCDASILLDGPDTEKTAARMARVGGLGLAAEDGMVLIDKIKTVLEVRCPGAVSCADILNLAARDALHLAGAASYPVFLGRRDGVESKAAWVDLPGPSISVEEGLAYFKSKGLDALDYATLLGGGHAVGRTLCRYILDRLYGSRGGPTMTMNPSLLRELRKQCPQQQQQQERVVLLNQLRMSGGGGSRRLFSNALYGEVLQHKAVLGADQGLLYNYNTTQLVLEYAKSLDKFRAQFALSVSRMGGLRVLTGRQGEIRRNCRSPNTIYY